MVDTTKLVFLFLIIMRMSGFIFLNPIFGRSNIPMIIKNGLVLALSLIVFSYTDFKTPLQIGSVVEFAVMLFKEFIVGFAVGFTVNIFLMIIIYAGEFMDVQMGLSMAKIYDSQSNSSISLSATFYNILFMLLFFAIDGHVAFMKLIISSGEVVPYGFVHIGKDLSVFAISLFINGIVLAVKMALPIIGAEFLSQIGTGILMKTIPQINIFVIDIQMKVFIGLILMLVFFTPMAGYIKSLLLGMTDAIRQIFEVMK